MAIQVNGTTVIDNSRNLTNVGGLKTIGGNSILGSGDITISSGIQFSATLPKSFSNIQYGNGYFVGLDANTTPYTLYYSSDGTTWNSYSMPAGTTGYPYSAYANNLRWYESAQKWVIFGSRFMYITSNPTSVSNWSGYNMYSGWGTVQSLGYGWGSGIGGGTRTTGRFIAGHGWTGSSGTWGLSYSDNMGASWSGGGAQSMGNFAASHYSGVNSGRVYLEGYEITNLSGTPNFNTSSNFGPSTNTNGFIRTINSTTDLGYRNQTFYYVSDAGGAVIQSSMFAPSSTNDVVWDSVNNQYIAIAANYFYTSPTATYWAANFSPTGGVAINGIAVGGGKLVLCGNNATFTATL